MRLSRAQSNLGLIATAIANCRLGRGQLRIEGRRLDAPASPLRAHVPNGYGEIGFQATALVFSSPGCWEVTGRVGDASLTFVTKVEKIREGPSWRRDITGEAAPPNDEMQRAKPAHAMKLRR